MSNKRQRQLHEDLPLNWCNDNAVTTSQLEAVSLVTPVLENFFMRTVAEALPRPFQTDKLSNRCLDFIREEANHSRIHRLFNNVLLDKLGKEPPGLAWVTRLLGWIRNHLSLPSRLLLAAALEHFAAVMSHVYVEQEQSLQMESSYARDMFAMHAREELGHCSVVFDLWRSYGATGAISRIIVILGILGVGSIYVGIAIPWILYHKSNRSLRTTVRHLLHYATHNWRDLNAYTPIRNIFAFVQPGYHPDQLFEHHNNPASS